MQSVIGDMLPALIGFLFGILLLLSNWFLERFKAIDQYNVVLPSFAILGLPFLFTYISNLESNLLKDLAPLGTLLLVVLGFLNYLWSQKTTRDKEIIQQLTLILERAYSILTDQGKNTAPPPPDRLNWLTSARLLLRYKKLKLSLSTDVYKTICDEQEEYWRYKFYLLIKDQSNYSNSFFGSSSGIGSINSNIAPKSALVVFNFASWNKERQDPLETMDVPAYFSSLPKGYGTLEAHLARFNIFRPPGT